ncbi:ABC transporter ATP-binding protein [Stenotrophobium rhamnosiphilum]|uniref:Nitrate ABC transporter ATP-binding protein n=1 Tax=Stenotrophobium rhamnosiphilum TaxID=2029166 RepID=A0A2T5MEM2_9GAMM|nr:ABC transporter ATP-binding protein [Stenotrophobium rhamnosiphilum]PTU31030.1 nitrate ABC transporter ATP-binding protein [Stenotrophobium rhamnosiphilum]
MTAYLEVDHATIEFKTRKGIYRAVQNVSIEVEQGEFVSIIGHSGCGKSTVLNLIAGLVPASSGGALLGGREISGPSPERAVVFQNHSLLPWLTCFGNVYLAVEKVFSGHQSKTQMRERTDEALALVGLTHARDKRPNEISGGMKQRVGIARALAMEPKVLLMDEPFGALDALTRANLQDSLMEIQARLKSTVVMVTHDVDEAVLLSDRIVMMTNGPAATVGQILSVDLPRPRNRLQLAEDTRYIHHRAEVLRFLHSGHGAGAIAA